MKAPLRCAVRARNSVLLALDSLDGLSHRLYVSRRGAFSIERLYALESYCRQTSRLRVAAVCSVLSLPAFLVSIVLELIPLQDPSEGWKANYGCWLRLYFICFGATLGAIMQIDALVPDLKLGYGAMLCVCLATSCIYIAVHIIIAASWVFPVPFSIVFGAFPWSSATVLTLLWAVGVDRLRSQSVLRHQMMQQIYMVGVQAALVVVYSFFSAAYYWLPPNYKILFVFVLPMIKIFMQHAVAWAMHDLEEYQPGIIVFCVGVFNALYMSKCMQVSGSHLTYALILGFETMQGYLAFRRMSRTMDRFRVLAQRCGRAHLLDGDLLNAIVQLSQEPEVVWQRQGRSLIRIRSPIQLHVPHDNTLALERLASERSQQTLVSCSSSNGGSFLAQLGLRSIKILPVKVDHSAITSVNPVPKMSPDRSAVKDLPQRVPIPQKADGRAPYVGSAASKQDIVSLSLKLLFECEFRVLVEYVESIIPVIYAMYIAIMAQLSSAQYYPETSGKSTSQIEAMVLNIIIYACMEALSFLFMQRWVQWKSSLSPARILAFVIENQTKELAGRLFVWYIVLLQFTLAHFGT